MSSDSLSLQDLGWEGFFTSSAEEHIERGYTIARVTSESRGFYTVRDEAGETLAQAVGKLIHSAADKTELPAVGDWVAIKKQGEASPASIHHVLPRKTVLLRRAAGLRVEAQVVASNVDTVFITMALDHNFNIRRLERYLILVRESGSIPVVILTKTDLLDEKAARQRLDELRGLAEDVTAVMISSVTGEGETDLRGLLQKGSTFCFVGSSGVGKSTLINTLFGEEVARTAEVRDFDAKGRHTTTQKQMFFMPGVGILIDTPGMRELGLWESSSAVDETFEDIEKFAQDCKYRDCAHVNEPGCAVLEAIAGGSLDVARYGSYVKLMDEARRVEYIQSASGAAERRRRAKKKNQK